MSIILLATLLYLLTRDDYRSEPSWLSLGIGIMWLANFMVELAILGYLNEKYQWNL